MIDVDNVCYYLFALTDGLVNLSTRVQGLSIVYEMRLIFFFIFPTFIKKI